MRNLRPALLVLLTASLAGLGVPAGFGQTKAATNGSSRKSSPMITGSSSSSAKNRHPRSATSKKTPANTSNKPSTTSSKKNSGKSSKKSSRKQPGQKAPTSDRVIEIQSALAKNGSFQGSPNGKWDGDTAEAMRKFQASHGLNPSGKLDAPTLQRLGLGSQTAGVAAPTPPPGSFSRLTSSNNSPTGTSDSPRHP